MADNRIQMSASLPKDLQEECARLHGLFEISSDRLKLITDKFLEELDLGLRSEGSDIPMNPTWVTSLPTGTERGQFLTVDLGGTNLRAGRVDLHGIDREYDVIQTEHRIPEALKSSTAERLWKYVASCLHQFLDQHSISVQAAREMPLVFTFSYPVTQHSLHHGILQRWTKGFNIRGVEGRDIVQDLTEVLHKESLPLRIVALVNDTVGTLMASAYADTKTQIGSIYGTGSNAAYMERCDQIPKVKHSGFPGETLMAINCEYGAFDNSARVLPFTTYDVEIDRCSPRPGQQRYEKLVAGLYLGEIMRLILVDLYDRQRIFQGQDGSRLKQPYVLNSCLLAEIENDQTRSLTSIRHVLQETLHVTPVFSESYLCRCVARLISRRSVRLYACGIAALLRKRRMQQCHVAVDGSVFSKYPQFPDRVMEALRDILGLSADGDDHIRLVPATDGSSVGAAVIAAVTMARREGRIEMN